MHQVKIKYLDTEVESLSVDTSLLGTVNLVQTLPLEYRHLHVMDSHPCPFGDKSLGKL